MKAFEPLLSARFVAAFRLVTAFIVMLAVWADPTQPLRAGDVGDLLMAAFVIWAILNLWAAYYDWWLTFRLARPALLIDVVFGVATVFFTEGSPQEFATPLAAFLMFVLVEAVSLGGWRLAATVGVLFTLGVLFVLLILSFAGLPPDPVRAGRRIGFFLLITSLAVWFGGRRTSPSVPQMAFLSAAGEGPPVVDALIFAKGILAGAEGMGLWNSARETETRMVVEGGEQPLTWNFEPDAVSMADVVHAAPTLFRARKGEAITIGRADFTVRCHEPNFSALGVLRDGQTALSIPVTTDTVQVVIVVWNIRFPSHDLLPIARAVGLEIEAGLNRHALSIRAVEDRLGAVRQSVARDLHDSVAQSLAGASFRIEAARIAIADGGDVAHELHEVQQSLHAEQRHVRDIIERLRSGRKLVVRQDLVEDLRSLLGDLEGQWRIDIALAAGSEQVDVGTAQLHEIRQIAREAVANAARHGGAKAMRFAIEVEVGAFHLDIVDDGRGGLGSAHPFRPRSIAERVAALGGKLDARRGPGGTRLYITVPRLSA